MQEKNLTSKDIRDARKIAQVFETLSEEDKNIVLGYTYALHDKNKMTIRREKMQHT